MGETDWGTIFEALANEHRRRVLVALLEHNPQSDQLDVPDDVQETDEDLELLRAKLRHNHLPKLEATGFIEWDRDTHEVVKGPKFGEIRPLLELIGAHSDELPDGWV